MNKKIFGKDSKLQILIVKLLKNDSQLGILQLIINDEKIGDYEEDFVISGLNCLEKLFDFSFEDSLSPDKGPDSVFNFLTTNIEKYGLALGQIGESFDHYHYFIYKYNNQVVLLFKNLKTSVLTGGAVSVKYFAEIITEAKNWYNKIDPA